MNRKYSLKKNKEFQYTYRAGKSYANKYMVLICARGRKGKVRIGFSVSKKVGNSVARNRVKRRLRECCRARLASIKPGYNCIFVARAGVLDADFAALGRSMEALLNRAGIVKTGAEAGNAGVGTAKDGAGNAKSTTGR